MMRASVEPNVIRDVDRAGAQKPPPAPQTPSRRGTSPRRGGARTQPGVWVPALLAFLLPFQLLLGLLPGIAAATPLHDAIREGDLDTAKRLIAEGADVSATNKRGNTALHTAARYGRIEIAELALAKGADLEARNARDHTPLHKTAKYGQPALAAWLIERGANVEALEYRGATPLHDAAQYGHEEVVILLLEAGAPTDRADRQGMTPAARARAVREKEILTLIRMHARRLKAAETSEPEE
jgi:hypothetical protein